VTVEQLEQHAAMMRLRNSERRLEELKRRIRNMPEGERRKSLALFWEQIRQDQRKAKLR
jgi:hypothetical protein